jgi:repressor LexA
MKRNPSKSLHNVYQAIVDYLGRNGYPPTVREIKDMSGLNSTSHVSYCLKRLEEKGKITLTPNSSRGIQLANTSPVGKFLPIKLAGRIAAGEPINIPASDADYYDSETTCDIPIYMVPSSIPLQDMFVLEVSGDSMIDAMISDGDMVVMARPNDIQNGDLVAAWLSEAEETTLKKIFIEENCIRLVPANPAYRPLILDKDQGVEIQGKVIAVIQKHW